MTGFRAWVTVTGVLLVGLAFTGCQTEPTTGHNVAILYGITDYGNTTKINNLKYPSLDVEALTPLLNSGTGGLFSTVIPRTDSAATKAQLKLDFQAAAAELTADSEFLFYYSGHGADGGLESTYPGTEGHALIVPYGDASTSPPTYSASTMVNETELAALVATLPTKKVVIILDSCYSGGFLQAASATDPLPQNSYAYYQSLWKAFLAGTSPSSGEALSSWYTDWAPDSETTAALASWNKALGLTSDQAQLLTAAGALEQSYDDPNTQHGAFTHWLLEAQAHGDFDGNGYVTVSEAYRYSFEGLQAQWNGVWGAVGAGTLSTAGSIAFLPHLSQGPADFLLFKR
ncbi:MAG TPA: caspase family protein [Spirochaetia bacterium]|jgi:hypothetical protein|nr:caspase family protein [Spirochaetia bacterium]